MTSADDAVAGAATENGGTVATMVKMVEMPVEFLQWVLEQDKEDYRVPTLEDYTQEELAEAKDTICSVIHSLQTAYDEFDDVTENMDFSDPKEWQENVNLEWAEARQEWS